MRYTEREKLIIRAYDVELNKLRATVDKYEIVISNMVLALANKGVKQIKK